MPGKDCPMCGELMHLPAGEQTLVPADHRAAGQPTRTSDRMLRVSAENLNRLLSLAGESLVESRWIKTFAESLLVSDSRRPRILSLTAETSSATVDSVIAAMRSSATRSTRTLSRWLRSFLICS